MSDELELALAWLHGTADWSEWRTRPPSARSLLDLRCDAPPGQRCLLGGVYYTPFGLVYYGLLTTRRTVAIEEGAPVKDDAVLGRGALLTTADSLQARPPEALHLPCTHGQDGSVEQMLTTHLVAAVRDRDTRELVVRRLRRPPAHCC